MIRFFKSTPISRTRCALLVAALSVVGIAHASDSGSEDSRAYFFTPTFGDLPEEMQVARDQGKLGMLLFYEGEDCIYCVRMRQQVFSQGEVRNWFGERFVSIAVDVYGDVEITDFGRDTMPAKTFADRNGVFATPTMSFLDLNGKEVFRYSGMIATPQEFLLLGEYVADKNYCNTGYDAFLRSRGKLDGSEALVTPTEAGES